MEWGCFFAIPTLIQQNNGLHIRSVGFVRCEQPSGYVTGEFTCLLDSSNTRRVCLRIKSTVVFHNSCCRILITHYLRSLQGGR